ncbi:gliding motility-associated C-terminal domain-containing protein [Cytophagaceae bacterium YF14B1]|uniref:Gliding motility-associated C-terminal domain-containing protein n=1 Tax=Xanthocytophaga flava TaxID=3048013 RepID=A0AAE3QJY4_9BACT|nr:gliding motility-associated C-terminal domain-containing protein [Xanthocytophaga flavus]MDJ1480762.1 gliding motility-associated C-terminal domain-containing protein [Xanthocytophaga flavus]
MRLTLTILILLSSFSTFSQVKIQNLYFNSTQNILRLNFANLPPTPLYTGIAGISKSTTEPEIAEGIAHVEDTEGNVIIWVNSNGVYDRTGTLMPGSASILADPSSTEIVICPVPNTTDQFYIFYNKKLCSTLLYATVDMKQRNGLGDVITQNNPIDVANTYAEGLEIIKIPCSNEYWLIAYQCSIGFKRFRIGISGIGTGAMVQSLTITNNNTETNYEGRGELDYHNGKIGYSISSKNRAYVADFNPTTGSFSNGKLLSFISGENKANDGMYGVEFSPDATKAYFTDWNNRDIFGDIASNNLFQYDFATQQIRSWLIPYQICSLSPSEVEGLGQIELGRDGKLYIPHVKGCQITVIENPNSTSPTFSTIDVNTVLSTGVSDHIQSEIFVPVSLAASKTSICKGESVILTVTGNANTYRWSSGIAGNSSSVIVSPESQTIYTVYALNQYGCEDSSSVTIKVKDVTSTISVTTPPAACSLTSATLTAPANMDLYEWYLDGQLLNGQTQSSLVVTQSGSYKVLVSSANCADESDEIIIELDTSKLKIPNVITPDKDINLTNETFKVTGTRSTLKLIICNRWGQEVYTSADYQNDWVADNLPDGLYYYYVSSAENCFPPQKGWLHVLRGPQN